MMDNIKVSIVVAVYNGAETLPRCIDSLLAQTYNNIEVICVNDCSLDKSLAVLEQYATKDKRMRVINHSVNKNAGGAYNTGIRVATGEYICIVDQDDRLRSNAIEIMVEVSEEGACDVIVPQWYAVNGSGKITAQHNLVVGTNKEVIIKKLIMTGCRIIGVLFKRKMLIDNNILYPENLFWEDNAVYVCFFWYAKNIKVIKDTLYYYYEDYDKSWRHVSSQLIEDRITSTDLFLQNLQKCDAYTQYPSEINYRYLYLTGSTIELLAEIPYEVAKPMAEYLSLQVSHMLPNKYFDNIEKQIQYRLLHPIEYLKKERNRRIKKNIKSLFHSIRHNTVVAVKKILGMDPTKSIYK